MRPVNPSAAAVDVQMTKHAFRWGTAVSAWCVSKAMTATAIVTEKEIASLFNTIVFQSDLKWVVWDKPDVRQDMLATMDWADKLGLSIRGHCFVWPSWRKNAPELKTKFAKDLQGLSAAIDEHIKDVATTTGSRIYEWDVLNEVRSATIG